jgi:hypothetical protein
MLPPIEGGRVKKKGGVRHEEKNYEKGFFERFTGERYCLGNGIGPFSFGSCANKP